MLLKWRTYVGHSAWKKRVSPTGIIFTGDDPSEQLRSVRDFTKRSLAIIGKCILLVNAGKLTCRIMIPTQLIALCHFGVAQMVDICKKALVELTLDSYFLPTTFPSFIHSAKINILNFFQFCGGLMCRQVREFFPLPITV